MGCSNANLTGYGHLRGPLSLASKLPGDWKKPGQKAKKDSYTFALEGITGQRLSICRTGRFWNLPMPMSGATQASQAVLMKRAKVTENVPEEENRLPCTSKSCKVTGVTSFLLEQRGYSCCNPRCAQSGSNLGGSSMTLDLKQLYKSLGYQVFWPTCWGGPCWRRRLGSGTVLLARRCCCSWRDSAKQASIQACIASARALSKSTSFLYHTSFWFRQTNK